MANLTTVKPVIVRPGDTVEIVSKGYRVVGEVMSASNPMVNHEGYLFVGYDANDYVVEITTERGDYRNWHGVSDGGTIRKV